MISAEALVELLDHSRPLVKTGILVVPAASIAELEGVALSLGVEYLDAAERWLSRLDPQASFAGISCDSLLVQIDEWASMTWHRRTLLLANIDVMMARLNEANRRRVWEFLHSNVRKRRTGLLFPLTANDDIVITRSEAERWERADRLASIDVFVAHERN
jgi:hypothetical protein